MTRRFADLVDVDRFAAMMQSFFEATGIPYGLIDVDGNILCGAGWQEICVAFHRVNPTASCRCRESDRFITGHLQDGPFVGYRCANGLMDYASPVIIDGQHLANVFTGQMLHEPPDREAFRRQAAEFGFDEAAYLAALEKVPVVPKERVEAAMAFFARLAEMLAGSGNDRLRVQQAHQDLKEINATLEDRVVARSAELAEANAALAEEVAAEWRAERELRRERDLSQAVIDSLPGIFYLLDQRGHFAMWNRNLEALVGFSGDELRSMPATELFAGDDRVLIAERVARVFHEGRAEAEATLVAKDGCRTPHYLTGVRVILDGAPYLVGVGMDLSERRRVAEALEEKAAALARSNAELEQFAYVASHDLREPLRMVTSFVTLLERHYGDSLDAEGREFIGFVRDGAMRMDRLVLDLLEYSRVGRGDRSMAPVDSGAALRQAVAVLQVAIDEAGATVELPAELPVVHGHFDELVRVFQNLLGNAVKYRRPGVPPVVKVSCQTARGQARFAVADNGIGIDPQFHQRIFLIFQRLHGRDEYEGTGIGLAICKKIVERHGGTLWVESEPDKGSTFWFTLRTAG